MRRFRDIIESPFPVPTNSLWINKGTLKGFINGKWVTIGGSTSISWNDIDDKPDFATVATSGSYNDLKDTPSIPSAYTLPIATANILGGVKSSTTGTTSGRDYNVEINSDGTMKVNVPWTDTNTTYSIATQSANGLMSSTDKQKLDTLILVPEGGTLNQVLKKTATGVAWGDDANTTYVLATTTESGLMSSADKTKLNNIETGANNYTLPNATTSVRGGVLMATTVTDLAGTEDAAAICTKINALLAALRTAGVLTA